MSSFRDNVNLFLLFVVVRLTDVTEGNEVSGVLRLSETINPVFSSGSFNSAAMCRELLLSRFGLGVSEMLPGRHWWLLAPACQKMFIRGHWRLGKIRAMPL